MRLIFGICIWLALCSAAHAEKRVALVIGNSAYQHTPVLTNTKNDAEGVAAALTRLGFDVMLQRDLTTAQFDSTIEAFLAKAQGADLAFLFYAGHGLQIDKRGFMAPVDVKVESESSALRELVAIQDVVTRIEQTAKMSVVVLDACRDSPLQERLRRVMRGASRSVTPPQGLPAVSVTGSNTLVVYATVPGEVAADGDSQNSPFTTALLKHIETPGLEIELLFKRVTADVMTATGGKQQPERLSRLQTEVTLQPGAVPPEARKQARETPLAPAPAAPSQAEVAQFCARVAAMTSRATVQSLAESAGDKRMAACASARLKELQQPQTAAIAPAAKRPEAAGGINGTWSGPLRQEGLMSLMGMEIACNLAGLPANVTGTCRLQISGAPSRFVVYRISGALNSLNGVAETAGQPPTDFNSSWCTTAFFRLSPQPDGSLAGNGKAEPNCGAFHIALHRKQAAAH